MALQPACHRGNSDLETTIQDFVGDEIVGDAIVGDAIVGDAVVGDVALVNSISRACLSRSNKPSCHLPNEILLEIFSYLEQPTLRRVRLVSKDFSQLAAEPLFTKIYISPSIRDVDVFTKITNHPTLARCIKTLAYDVSEFKISNLTEYKELSSSYFRLHVLCCPELISHFSLHEVEHLTDLPREPSENNMDYHPIVVEGYRKYSRQKKEQEACRVSKDFFHHVCAGLVRMTRLRKVAFEYKWKDHPAELMRLWARSPLQPPYSASSLAKSWNPYHLKPGRPGLFHLTCAFLGILEKLWATGHSVKEIHFADSLMLPGQIFNFQETEVLHSEGSKGIQRLYLATTQNLRKLTISVQHFSGEDPDTKNGVSTDLFEFVLLNAPNLIYLCLSVSQSVHHEAKRTSLSELFPNEQYPKKLVWLRLEGIRSSEEELFRFFRCLPELRHLGLRDIDIERGCWQGLWNSVTESTALCSFHMRDVREVMTGVTVDLVILV